MADLSKPAEPGRGGGEPHYDPDEIFVDQLRDLFIIFTALTVTGMEAFILARRQYRKQHSLEHTPHD